VYSNSMKRFLNFLLLFLFLAENSSSQSCVDSSSRFLLQSGTARINVRDNLVLADSSVIIAGNIREPSQSVSHFFISRLDKHNNILYSKRLDGFNGSVHQVIACSNGDILVAAMTYPTPL